MLFVCVCLYECVHVFGCGMWLLKLIGKTIKNAVYIIWKEWEEEEEEDDDEEEEQDESIVHSIIQTISFNGHISYPYNAFILSSNVRKN